MKCRFTHRRLSHCCCGDLLHLFLQVGVVGLGLMGHGIVQVAAMASSPTYSVIAVESSQDAIDIGRKRIDDSMSKMISRKVRNGKLTASDADKHKCESSSRISYASERGALANCDMVIEAITENPDIKLPLFKDLAQITRSDCILASNTSSLSIMVSVVA